MTSCEIEHKPPITIALLGAPNCGKSSLFNALTGGRAKIANYPGVTVEYAVGNFETKSGQNIRLMDLPGIYGDCGHSADERVTLDAIHGRLEGERAPEALIVVMDAAQIRTHLHNVLQAKNYGLPMIVVLNMMDMAARDGVDIDLHKLEQEIGVPVITSVAVRTAGRQALVDKLEDWGQEIIAGNASTPKSDGDSLKDLQRKARVITRAYVTSPKAQSITTKIDNVVLHPVFGPILLLLIMFVMFQAVYAWSAPFISLLEGLTSSVGTLVGSFLADGWFKSLLVSGVIDGVGAVIVFLPQIIILFMFILALESSGYMTRAAFLIDSLMAKVGLNGRAFIPLLSSFACAIPGIMAARSIENERDRLTTIMIAPLMTCSARWPVYFLLVGAFIPSAKLGIFNVQGLTMFGLVIIGVIFAFLAAFVLKKTLLKGGKPTLLLEMPSYKIPSLKGYLLGLWQRAMIFIKRAGRIILPASIIIWFLSTYPNNDGVIRNSFAGMIGRVLEPIFAPIGFNLEMIIALIPAMAAREIAVSSLEITYGIESAGENASAIQSAIAMDWTLPMGLAFLAWFIFAPQCLSTLAITRKETNSWKWPLIMFGYLFGLAYLAAGLTFWGAKALGW
ncbi:MAG: ferrous iron transporter B [Robiginitomaculum sp.]|nr:ferrous iron transporter B [Robiginitomaculum sp.]